MSEEKQELAKLQEQIDHHNILYHQKLWKYVENANFMTVNEKREAFGLSPLNSL